MKFEGTVQINAPRSAIWAALTNPELLTRITPGVFAAETLIPDREFQLQTGFQIGGNTISQQLILRWVDVQPDNKLAFTACTHFGTQAVEVFGEIFLGNEVAFSAEISRLPRHLPPHLLHSVAAQTIRGFFKNLKSELETA